jgi:hypothetical protein
MPSADAEAVRLTKKLLYVLQKVTVMEQKAIPADILNVIPSEPARILLLEGETHLLSEPIIARSKCEIMFNDEAQLQACVQAIRESGEQTKLKIESGQQTAYTWDRTFREGMTIIF